MDLDEKKIIDAIRERIDNSLNDKYTDDDILDVIDMIYDYYDINGLLDISFDQEDDDVVYVRDIVDYVTRLAKKDKDTRLDINDIQAIVEAEIAFEEENDEI